MDRKKVNYYNNISENIIVKKLTKEVIEETIHALAKDKDGYWLKLHHFATAIDPKIFDQLQAEAIRERKELNKLDNKDELLDNF